MQWFTWFEQLIEYECETRKFDWFIEGLADKTQPKDVCNRLPDAIAHFYGKCLRCIYRPMSAPACVAGAL